MIGKIVYTLNAKTNTVDEWICIGQLTGQFRGKKERLCILQKDKKQLVLPKRCVFLTEKDALAVAKL